MPRPLLWFRNVASRWPLVLALVFSAYACLLIANVYRSQDQLKSEADQRMVADALRQAAAVADLVNERRDAAVELATSAAVTNYFTNRALGMSLRYGLNANLAEIEERFHRRQERLDLRGRPVFRRAVLFDEAGHILVDIAPGDGPLAPAVGVTVPGVTVDVATGKLVAVAPVRYQDAIRGVVLAVGDLAQLFSDLVVVGADGSRREFLVTKSGSPLPAGAGANAINRNFALAAAALPESIQTPSSALAKTEGTPAHSVVLRTAVPGTDLSLVTIRSEQSLYGRLSSRLFLYSAGAFPILLLLAAFMFDRMRQIELALARSEQRFHTIFDNIKDTVFIVDAVDGTFLEANPAVLEMFGYRQEEVAGLTADVMSCGLPGFGPRDWTVKMQAARNTPQFFEWYGQRRNGEFYWAGIGAQHAQIDGKDRLLVVVRDITRRRAQEQALIDSLEHTRQLNARLEETQTQLLQSEKMASIGQLAAGVAHEINNPVGFVNSNLSTLEGYVADLMALLAAYEESEGALPPERQAELAALRQRLDVDYLRDDIGKLLKESLEGVQRVCRIVADLKDFSHVGQSEFQWASIESGLDSTLNVVWNELKYKADVVKEYAGVPEIQCMMSQLNQVFMNLLMNAVQSIKDHGRIIVRTGFDDEQVWVEVEDSGSGIAPEHLSRIFEPFFTTKPVGTGIGLGLSLSYGVVRKHQGEITVKSEVGVGTTFRVSLPRKRMADTPAEAAA